jgi:hypothetical protein
MKEHLALAGRVEKHLLHQVLQCSRRDFLVRRVHEQVGGTPHTEAHRVGIVVGGSTGECAVPEAVAATAAASAAGAANEAVG